MTCSRPLRDNHAPHLVEGLGIGEHLLHDLPRLVALRRADDKLLNLLELVDPAGWGTSKKAHVNPLVETILLTREM